MCDANPGVEVFVIDKDGTKRPPTQQEAKDALMAFHGMTEEQFDRLERQYLTGRMGDSAGFEWYFDPSKRK